MENKVLPAVELYRLAKLEVSRRLDEKRAAIEASVLADNNLTIAFTAERDAKNKLDLIIANVTDVR